MRVSRVKAHLGKVLEYIRSLDGEHTMYSKTLDQFNEMADMCQEIIDEIRKITNNGCENKLSGDGIESMFLELKGDISMLKRAIRVPESDSTIPENLFMSANPENKLHRYTSAQCREIIEKFTECIKNNADIVYDSDAANQCSDILWKWFHCRYLTFYDTPQPFKYNVMDIKNYIHAVIIAFGYHYENGTLNSFYDQFSKWEYTLKTSNKSNHYVVPYDAWSIGRRVYAQHVTLTSAIIWHMFSNSGLKPICCEDEDGAFFTFNGMIDRLMAVNPDISDEFDEYLKNEGRYV